MAVLKKILSLGCLAVFSYAALWYLDDILDLSQYLISRDETPALFYSVDPTAFPDTFSLGCVVSPTYRAFGVREGLLCLAFSRLSFAVNAQYHSLMGNYRLTAAFPLLREKQIRAGLQIHYALSHIPGYETRQALSCSAALRIIPHSHWRIFIFNRNFLDLSVDDQVPFLEPLLHAGLTYAPGGIFRVSCGLRKRASYDWQFYGAFSCSPLPALQMGLQYDYPQSASRIMLRLSIRRWEFCGWVQLHPRLGISFISGLAYAF
ncbi:MAG: hypothetical protein PHX07_00505 [Candidatus Marinimicrobia bacterium]|jgi:hypothetical protein|nr:hypothetical protein [Candidatus Neomarinimicrobiota bacterium]MDD4960699.1 hypothetical protein [Candidatus Neomarinimicrobiota bacterium]MDD5709863.1 hypothetical protein [Candidatus Neomarinimicrobiota bacterium]MDX9777184.1 hypothetical protein [bacterium]